MFVKFLLLHIGDILTFFRKMGTEVLMLFDSIGAISHKFSILIRSIINAIRYDNNRTFYHVLLTIIVIVILWMILFKK